MVVQWLRLCASKPGGLGSVPGWGTKIPHVEGAVKKKKKAHRSAVDLGLINMSHEFANLEVTGQPSMDSVAPSSRGPHS